MCLVYSAMAGASKLKQRTLDYCTCFRCSPSFSHSYRAMIKLILLPTHNQRLSFEVLNECSEMTELPLVAAALVLARSEQILPVRWMSEKEFHSSLLVNAMFSRVPLSIWLVGSSSMNEPPKWISTIFAQLAWQDSTVCTTTSKRLFLTNCSLSASK